MRLMRERILAMKEIWREREASFDGEFVRFDRIWSDPKPLQRPHPPILVGGNGPTVFDRVLEYGDAWMPNHARNVADRIGELRERAGRHVPVIVMGPPADPAVLVEPERSMWLPPKQGPFVAPGTFSATLDRLADGEVMRLAGPVSFAVDTLGNATLAAEDRAAVTAFQRQVAALQRAVQGAEIVVAQLDERLKLVRKAISTTPGLAPELDVEARALALELEEISIALSGDRFLRGQERPAPPSISDRVLGIVFASWTTTAEPTGTQRDGYRWAGEAFAAELAKLRGLAEERLPAPEATLDAAGAPHTPGRLPVWPSGR